MTLHMAALADPGGLPAHEIIVLRVPWSALQPLLPVSFKLPSSLMLTSSSP